MEESRYQMNYSFRRRPSEIKKQKKIGKNDFPDARSRI
jgi:hypothetical protein